MTLVPFKFVVQAVVLELDDDGVTLGEKMTEPVTLYGLEKLADFAATFETQLADAEQAVPA